MELHQACVIVQGSAIAMSPSTLGTYRIRAVEAHHQWIVLDLSPPRLPLLNAQRLSELSTPLRRRTGIRALE